MAIDPKKTLDAYQAKRGEIRLVEVPPLQYLMVDGAGDPNTAQVYQDAVTALFPLAYTLKFASRKELGIDTVVMPLEGLWHADDMNAFTAQRDKSAWLWTLMIMVPEHVTVEMFADAVESVAAKAVKKKESPSPALSAVRLETLDEGLSVQTLHVGAFDDEGPVLGVERRVGDDVGARRLRGPVVGPLEEAGHGGGGGRGPGVALVDEAAGGEGPRASAGRFGGRERPVGGEAEARDHHEEQRHPLHGATLAPLDVIRSVMSEDVVDVMSPPIRSPRPQTSAIPAAGCWRSPGRRSPGPTRSSASAAATTARGCTPPAPGPGRRRW